MSESERPHYQQELSRSLSLLEIIFLTLSSASPAGSVFIYAPVLIASLGGASVMAIAVAGALATCVAMCYAELATIYPIAGGEYTWAARVLGRPVGFALFMLTLVAGPGVVAITAAGASEYLTVLWPALPGTLTPAALTVFATTIATLDIRTNSWITGGFLVLELLVLAGLALLGLICPARGASAFITPQVVTSAGELAAEPWSAVIPVVPVALLMLAGYQNVVYFAEETTGATRRLGRAVLVSLAVMVAIQLASLGAVIVGARSLVELMTAASPLSDFARERGGTRISAAMSLGIAIAIVNALIVVINVWARILFASARDRSWPAVVDRFLATVHARFRTPVPATIVIGSVAVAASSLPFNWLVTATAGVGILQMIIVGATAIRAREFESPSAAGYRMPAWPWPAVTLIVVALGLLYQSAMESPSSVGASLGTMVIGIAYYYGFIHARRGERWTLPSAVSED